MSTYTFPTTAASRMRSLAGLCLHADLGRNAVKRTAPVIPAAVSVPADFGTEQGRPPRGVPR